MLAPLFVGIALRFMGPKSQEVDSSTINISGDLVSGDKYDINLSNPIEHKDLDKRDVENIKLNIAQLKREYPDTEIKILFGMINANEGTKSFAYEFKRIMEESGISTRVVSHMEVGGPQRDFPIYFYYCGLEPSLIMDYIESIQSFFSPTKGQIKTSKPTELENIEEGFNLSILVCNNVFFDQRGRIYFNQK